jgi:hypothetical protein
MNTNSFTYATKDGNLYRKSHSANAVNWQQYIPDKCAWASLNKKVSDSSLTKITIDQMLDLKYRLDQESHPEHGDNFVGRYVYFETSGNLYKVVNSNLECDKYIGNGNWKEKHTKITMVGAVNNVITERTAMDIVIPQIDSGNKAAITSGENTAAQWDLDKPAPKVELTNYVGRFFMNNNRLFKVENFCPEFNNRYRCLLYSEKSGLWKHGGFFGAATLSHKIVTDSVAHKFIEQCKKHKGESLETSLKSKFNVTAEEAERMKDNMEIINKEPEQTQEVKPEDEKGNEDIKVGTPFLYANRLYKVSSIIKFVGVSTIRAVVWTKEGKWLEDQACSASVVTSNEIYIEAAVDIVKKDCEALLNHNIDYSEALMYFKGDLSIEEQLSPSTPVTTAIESDEVTEEPAKSIRVRVAVTLAEGSMIRAHVAGKNRKCIIDRIIEPEDNNITVEELRAESLAELFEDIKVINLSKDKVTQLIKEKLEERYVLLKYGEEDGVRYVYLSISQLEEEICVVRGFKQEQVQYED